MERRQLIADNPLKMRAEHPQSLIHHSHNIPIMCNTLPVTLEEMMLKIRNKRQVNLAV
jgi:hypothetical protein